MLSRMTSRHSLLRASLLAIATPLVACGGSTTRDTGATGAAGAGGSASGGSAGTSSGGSTSGGAAGSGAKTKFPCTNPVAIVVDGKDTGYDTCAAGEVRRREVKACPSLVPRTTACSSGSTTDGCKLDADCKDKANGFCESTANFGGLGCACLYGCTSDADCGADSICVCGDPVGRCAPAKCKGPADCKEGDCTSYDASPGCSFTTFACQLATDTCGGDKDCAAGTGATTCSYPQGAAGAAAASRGCQTTACAIGRPLFVDHQIRTSTLAARADWA